MTTDDKTDAALVLDGVSDLAERVGYMRAVNELMDEMNRLGMKGAVVAIALFARAKGIAK